MFLVSYPCAFLGSSHVQHSFSSDGLQTLNSHCDMYAITNTIAEVIACTRHKQIKKTQLGLLLYSREHCRRDSESRSGSGRLRRESQDKQKANYERGRMQDKAAGDVLAMTLPLGRPP